MATVVLISCVSKKLKQSARAEDMYQSPYFFGQLAYAKSFNPDKIFILSAKYGLLELDDMIDPYNTVLKGSEDIKKKHPDVQILTKAEKEIWDQKTIDQLKQKVDIENDSFILLAGVNYISHLRIALKNSSEPLKGLGIGRRLGFLKKYYSK